jgi:outer membrane protein assembly factor BamB
LPGLLLGLAGLLLSLFPRLLWVLLKLLWRFKLPIVVMIGVICLAVWQVRALWPHWWAARAAEQQSGDDWPMIRGGPSRTGAVDHSDESTRAGVQWVFRPGKAAIYCSPAVVGNRVYVSTAQTAVFGAGQGEIVCLDADTGSVVWRSAPAGYRPTFSSPVVSGSSLVCGEGLHFTRDSRVICLDLAAGQEGEILWTFRTGSHVECTPVIHGGRVYVGAGDDGYYCLDLEPDEGGEPRVVWHLDGAQYPDAETSLIVHDNRVYAGLGRGGKAICMLDADTGEEIRRIPTAYPVFSPPAIADGKLYVGMGSGDYVHRAEEIGKPPAGELWCLDLQTLAVLWSYPVDRTILGSPAVFGDRVYFGSRDGFLYCLRTDGRLAAKFNAHAPIVTGPAVSDRYVYVVADSGTLYALDRITLEHRWEQKIGTGGLLVSSPASARGHVYVGTERDGLVCAGQPGEENVLALWPARSGGAARGGNLDDTPVPRRGAFHWQYPADQMGQTQQSVVAAPPAAWGNHLYIPLAGAPPRRGIVCVPTDGAQQETPPPAWEYETTLGIHRSPVVRGKLLLAVDGQPGDTQRRLHAISRMTGARRWQSPVEDHATGVLMCTESNLLVADRPGGLTCRDFKGRPVWKGDTGGIPFPPTVVGALLVAATVDPARLCVLDLPTGRRLWEVELAAQVTTPPVVADATVYVGTNTGLLARSLVDGRAVACQKSAGQAVASDLVLTPEWIVFVTGSGEVTVVDRATRTVLANIGGAVPGTPPLVVRDRLFFFGSDGLLTLETDDLKATPLVWADTSWLGQPTTPMIFCRSSFHVGMVGWGLVRLGENP